ncbi:hypothetical protein [Nitrosopumilus sp.]|uniref:hypothetical protein n=1 Tax=Nitrosopumilus sp. TaxID=2024843 RepID=UPI003B5A6DCD
MPPQCKGICSRISAENKFGNANRYAQGYKRCNFCAVFFKINDLRCPCCGLKMRTRSRVNIKRRQRNVEVIANA